MMSHFVTAMRFLTLLPLPGRREYGSGDLARSMRFFPLAGLLIGVLSWGCYSAAANFFPPRTAALVLLAMPIFLSGGLHMDGFADFCDGFFSGKDRAGILRIMRDPHLGTWAVLGLVLLLISKWEILILVSARPAIFLLALTAARWSQVVFSRFFIYARIEGGLGGAVAGKAGNTELLAGALPMVPLLIWAGLPCVFIFGVYLCFLLLFGFFVQRKLGGVTGDVLGAVSELSEWVILAAAAALR